MTHVSSHSVLQSGVQVEMTLGTIVALVDIKLLRITMFREPVVPIVGRLECR